MQIDHGLVVNTLVVFLLARNILPPYRWVHQTVGSLLFHARVPGSQSPHCRMGFNCGGSHFSHSIYTVLCVSMRTFLYTIQERPIV